jgi:hypothetical protein
VPPLVRRYIKTSFLFLVAGLVLGGYILVAEFTVGRYPPRLFITAHVHLLLVGFMLMLVMGVATWMFPRPARDGARGSGVLDHDDRHRATGDQRGGGGCGGGRRAASRPDRARRICPARGRLADFEPELDDGGATRGHHRFMVLPSEASE